MNKSKYNHLKSTTHKTLDESIIREYIIPYPIFEEIDEIMKRYINIYNRKYERYLVGCVLKLITTKNRVRYNRITTRFNSQNFLNCSTISILSRINKKRFCFSLVSEMRITFSSSLSDMTNNYHLKQQLPMCKVRLNQLLAENLRLKYRLKILSSISYTRKSTN